jgi:hypothetical protein
VRFEILRCNERACFLEVCESRAASVRRADKRC